MAMYGKPFGWICEQCHKGTHDFFFYEACVPRCDRHDATGTIFIADSRGFSEKVSVYDAYVTSASFKRYYDS